MNISDWMIILATLVGPILAVQAQKFLERSREGRLRRLSIFRTLMATRANVISPSHVEALNAIAIEFYGTKLAFKAVVDAWKDYLDHLNKDTIEIAIWDQKRRDLFVELISRMAPTVGYKFSKLEITTKFTFLKLMANWKLNNKSLGRDCCGYLPANRPFPLIFGLSLRKRQWMLS